MTQEANNQQTKPQQTTIAQQAQKVKQRRPRKTIEQELAELEARKQKLLESKRRAEAHEKIIFGATVIAMLKDMRKKGDPMAKTIIDKLNEFSKKNKGKDYETIGKITAKILEIKPEGNLQLQGKIQLNSQGQQHHQIPPQQKLNK